MSKPAPDFEISMMRRFCSDLATLQPSARRRVLAYVCARVDSLPALSADSGGTDEEHEEELPMMPHLHGAAAAE